MKRKAKRKSRAGRGKHGDKLRDPSARMEHAREGPPDAGTLQLRKVRTTREALAARKLELQIAKLKGDVIEREAVETMLARRASVFRRLMQSFGRRVAPQVVAISDVREIAILLQAEADAVVSAAYEQRWNAFDTDDDSDG